MNFYGLFLGVIAFLTIGISHPVVAKTEYHWGKKVWWVFFVAGLLFSVTSLFVNPVLGSVILGTVGFSCFWSTHEIFKQHHRVIRGQAKRNPNRMYEGVTGILAIMFLHSFNFAGLIVGSATFAIIAISRYMCIKAEYYFTKKFWIGFLVIGLVSLAGSLWVENLLFSTILGINGFTFLWGIGEIIEQEERVNKGWFPKNPERR